MKKIIIDCDPGHDDIMAIFSALAHPEEFEILGYTTVCGNQLLDKVTYNLCSVLTMIKQKGLVAKGYSAPLVVKPEPQPAAHGESGLDGPVLEKPMIDVSSLHALEFMKKCLEDNDQVTIIALAPLTNVAMLIKTYPHLISKIERICLMGGSSQGGNILPRSEFNIYADPHAAKVVFESGISITMAGLEVCDTVRIKHEDIDNLRYGGRVSKLAHDILQFFSLYNRTRGKDTSPIFDQVPVMELLHPELFESEMCQVDIECCGEYTRGMTVVQPSENGHVKVLLKGKRDEMIHYFLEDIKILDKKYEEQL